MYKHPEIYYKPEHPLLNHFKHSGYAVPGPYIEDHHFELVKPPLPTKEELAENRRRRKENRRRRKIVRERERAKRNLDIAQKSVLSQEAHNLKIFNQRRELTTKEPKKCLIGINDFCPLGYNKKYLKWKLQMKKLKEAEELGQNKLKRDKEWLSEKIKKYEELKDNLF